MKPHDYMEKCPYCGKYLLAKQVRTHVCDSPFADVREIPVMFFYETTRDDGDKLVIARGFDGVLYRLVKCHNPLSDDSYHEHSNRRKVNRTLNSKSA
jgi:hypothetical protein